MPLLKSVVIGLGVLIFLGLGLLAYGFIQKANNPDWRRPTPAPATDAATAKPFGILKLGLPEGCIITGVWPDDGFGGARVYLSIGSGGGTVTGDPCNRVIVIDTSRGRILGTIMPGP